MRAIATASRTFLRLFVDDAASALAIVALLVGCGALAHAGLMEDLLLAALLVAGSVAILVASVASAAATNDATR